MAYKIKNDCNGCGACEPECPHAAIREGDVIYVIDTEKCTECVGSYPSSKCAEVCPVGAPAPDPRHKETKEQLLEKWCRIHPGETPKVF
ncbi:MAG: 4Fe-4S ferredoxin [Chloroflexi bacterium RBG_16_56_11]|nr:MAG: 4Fe-4S ferredoxin [Chloroflexi bacterium RBG_16_56_11]